MNTNDFSLRHIGIGSVEAEEMLKVVGVKSLDELISQTLPDNIRLSEPLDLPEAMTEREFAEHIGDLASKNEVFTSYIGQGWYDCVTPPVVIRNILENPVWYTSYTPYQAEISQGRLEALFNFQSLITDLTALPLSNCSLLDEATAAAEAAMLMFNERPKAKVKAGANVLFVDEKVFTSSLNVIRTRGLSQGMEIVVGDFKTFEFNENVFGAIVQYPNKEGKVEDYKAFVEQAHSVGALVAVAADLMSLVMLTPPGEWDADICFGSSQRFGIPMYFGGPSAGFFACRMDYKRTIPGRIIGISKDRMDKDAFRLALQTREQHIKRERATSNICTAQALLATMTSFYAAYHGPEGLKNIARRIHAYTGFIAKKLSELGYSILHQDYFDTLLIKLPQGVCRDKLREIAEECCVNFYYPNEKDCVQISLDETTLVSDLGTLCYIFAQALGQDSNFNDNVEENGIFINRSFLRSSQFLSYDVFNKYHTETEMMRYMKRLERKDISLTHSMISLGSCTMKLNAASEVIPLSNPAFCNVHPYAPKEQVAGTTELLENLKQLLGTITGLPAVSLQPNSGAAGEYAGLKTIRSYHIANGQGHRSKVLLPASAHGTNPASAAQCGYKCIIVACDEHGNVDWADFMAKTEEHKDDLAAMMITYPSTHGIFETNIIDLCKRIHDCGALVYMDGANMNAQVGLTNPGFIGADVCHLNLHKTFAIPHGGGGPGSGPICATRALEPYMPTHSLYQDITDNDNVVAASPEGSAGVDVVSYAYIRMLGTKGLERSTKTAILNANYMAAKLKDTYGIVYTGATGRVGHELILDCRKLRDTCGVDESDIAKRLMDFGYHAPTLSFPVHGTLMIEPTESESKAEIDRFLEVMDCIWAEIQEVKNGVVDKDDNVLKNAPHPEYEVVADEWNHSYSRSKAAYPLPYLKENKFWLNVARVDNGFGDRNLIPAFCACIMPSLD